MSIKIKIPFSESNVFTSGQEFTSLADLDKVIHEVSFSPSHPGGYFKTDIIVCFGVIDVFKCQLDIDNKDAIPPEGYVRRRLRQSVNWALSELGKPNGFWSTGEHRAQMESSRDHALLALKVLEGVK